MDISIRILKERQDTVRSNWGFVFALLCATLWGTCYQGIGFLLNGEVFGASPFTQMNPYVSSFLIAAFLSLLIWLITFIWLIPNKQVKEWLRFISSLRRENLLCLICAFCGGVAAWSTYLIAASLDTTFSVIMVMFYPAIGRLFSQRILNEKASKRYFLGMAIIVLGWIILYLPDLLSSNPIEHLPLYIIGAVAGIGWGIEGTLAAKVMETVDISVVVNTRYAYECVLWVLAGVAVVIFLPDSFNRALTSLSLSSFGYSAILAIIAGCLAINYLCWYKSFLFCGVSRGLAVSDVSGFVTVIVGMLLLTSFPDWPAVIACIFMAVGVYSIYSDPSADNSVLRNVNRTRVSQRFEPGNFSSPLSDKQAALHMVASQGALWDYEVVAAFKECKEFGYVGTRRAYRLRTYLIEATAAGILIPIEYTTDNGSYFDKGKLLTKYAMTEYGITRIAERPERMSGEND